MRFPEEYVFSIMDSLVIVDIKKERRVSKWKGGTREFSYSQWFSYSRCGPGQLLLRRRSKSA
jgi:hypothetical protein